VALRQSKPIHNRPSKGRRKRGEIISRKGKRKKKHASRRLANPSRKKRENLTRKRREGKKTGISTENCDKGKR